jgi:ABC-type glycerol-3-phosphate transport system substrate-binding protein
VIYYNADLLDRLRLPAPQPGWTAGDFIQLATQAASGEGPEHVYGVVPFSIDPLSLLMAVRGASWYAPEAGLPTANLEDESVVQAVAWLQEMVRLGVIPPVFGESAPMQAENLVTSGRAALWIGYAGLLGGFTEGKPPPFRIGVAPPPSSPVPLPPPLVNGMYVSRHAAQPQACLSWLAFLSEQPAAFSGVPARRSVAESPAWEAQVGVQVAGAYRAALEQPLLSQPPDPNQLGWLVSAVAQVAAGQDPASALAEAQRKADDYQACLVAALDQGLEQRQACAGQTP